MKVFHCDHCAHLLFFENTQCVQCERSVAYLPDLSVVGSLDPTAEDGIESFRGLFGDERLDYGEALQAHYRNGPAAEWPSRFTWPRAALPRDFDPSLAAASAASDLS